MVLYQSDTKKIVSSLVRLTGTVSILKNQKEIKVFSLLSLCGKNLHHGKRLTGCSILLVMREKPSGRKRERARLACPPHLCHVGGQIDSVKLLMVIGLEPLKAFTLVLMGGRCKNFIIGGFKKCIVMILYVIMPFITVILADIVSLMINQRKMWNVMPVCIRKQNRKSVLCAKWKFVRQRKN